VPQARTEGSQGQVRSTPPLDQRKKRTSPERATEASGAVFCRPFGPEIFLRTIQGPRASRLPLATFCSRLRRYRC